MGVLQRHPSTSHTVSSHHATRPLANELAGYAYCGVAALSLLDRAPSSSQSKAIQEGIPDRPKLLEFLAKRQFGYLAKEESDDDEEDNFIEAKLGQLSLGDGCNHVGFNGRWNKKADTCYTWWVASTLVVSYLSRRSSLY